MGTFTFKGKSYEIDDDNILLDFDSWDENFAVGMSANIGIKGGLSKEHCDIINFIRNTYKETGRVPLVYETAIAQGLDVREGKHLFPSGYLRGACVLSGVSYKEGYVRPAYLPQAAREIDINAVEKTYVVDIRGFLMDPGEWNQFFAIYRAYDCKIPGGRLTERHWQIINYLREQYARTKNVPNIWETCDTNNLSIKELEVLFPDGYHRGAVKLAGLRVR
jgi:tRNA 2-thiouridine synthesizing protein E